jgi:8-oxo-dGTP pyrophosphatase MutT (NUDIX family)
MDGDARLRMVLDAYEPRDELELRDVRRLTAALGTVDVWSRTSPLHVTGSALILHPPSGRVLLRWHTRMQRWMQVGGHCDPGETDPWLVAQREAEEETGLPDLAAQPRAGTVPVQIVIVPVPEARNDPAHEHADIRFLLVTDRPDDARPETSAAPLRWLTIAEALDEVEEANLRDFLHVARRYV